MARHTIQVERVLALYAQGVLSFGKASERAELSRFAFAELVADRNISRHYTENELMQDIEYARNQ